MEAEKKVSDWAKQHLDLTLVVGLEDETENKIKKLSYQNGKIENRIKNLSYQTLKIEEKIDYLKTSVFVLAIVDIALFASIIAIALGVV